MIRIEFLTPPEGGLLGFSIRGHAGLGEEGGQGNGGHAQGPPAGAEGHGQFPGQLVTHRLSLPIFKQDTRGLLEREEPWENSG